ncbi:MAG TPA: polyprenyl synthetase family protein, partial [Candidatus Obscuribacterales bacterium]
LYAWLLAEDLGGADQPWAMPLTAACACFYAAADLFDDIQDLDAHQPVIQASSPAQAINIANLLLMQSQQLLLDLPLPAGIRLHLLEVFAATGQTMSIGQSLDIHSTNRQSLEIEPEGIVRKKAGAEFACFIQVVAIAMEQAPDPATDRTDNANHQAYAALGEEIGSLLQIFTDFYDIWVPQAGQKLSQDLAIHKNSFPLYWARADRDWQEPVHAWLAGLAGTAPRQLQLRRLLAQTRAVEKFAAYLQAARQRVEALFQALPPLPQIQGLWAEECQYSAVLIETLSELRAKTRGQDFHRSLELAPALAKALDYLDFIPEYRDAWEVQRSDFLGEPRLVGNLFNPLLILESLLALGHEIGPELRQVLGRRQEDGWHYYTHCDKIPPDSDDLGQILQLVGRTGLTETAGLLAGPLHLLEANLDAAETAGYCPTWLCDEQHYKRAEVDTLWFGKACPGVMANLYYGLAHYDNERYCDRIQQGITYLLGQFDPQRVQWPAVHYRSHLYVAYLMARLLVLSESGPACLGALRARILDEQALDGSWFQQPQATAFALLFLLGLPDPPPQAVLDRAMFYLLDSQDYDGSWPGEAFFVRPGRKGAFESFAHPKLGTAFVLRALAGYQARGGAG